VNLTQFGYRAYAIPLGVRTSQAAVAVRRGFHFYVRDAQGRTGFGDAAPWPGSDEELRLASAGLSNLTGALFHGARPGQSASSIADFCRANAITPEAAWATELAMLDLLAQQRRVPVSALLHPEPASTVRSHGLVDGVGSAALAAEHGFDTLKVKVGADLDADDARLGRIREAVGPDVRLRIDANGAWTRDEACWAIERLMRHDLALVEQPVDGDLISDLGFVRRRMPVDIAADEAVTGPVGLRRILAEEAADVVVLKPMFVGGARATHELAQMCAEAGVPVYVTHALESAVGRAGAVHIAAALPPQCRGTLCGVGTDLRAGPEVAVPTTRGLGVVPQEAV
jgi:L-Ala-D/L-Glu epimerase